MSAEDARRCLDRANVHLCRSETDDATRWLDRSQAFVGETSRELALRGLVEHENGDDTKALTHFQRALELDPSNSRAFANAAALLMTAGKKDEAIPLIDRAAAMDPRDREIRRLRSEMATESGQHRLIRGEPHTIGWIIDAGPAWTTVGWMIASLTVLLFLVTRFVHPVGSIDVMAKDGGLQLYRDPLSIMLTFMTVSAIALSFAWVVTDLIDRRGRAIWLVPMVVGTFCIFGGLTGIAHGLYLSIGRR